MHLSQLQEGSFAWRLWYPHCSLLSLVSYSEDAYQLAPRGELCMAIMVRCVGSVTKRTIMTEYLDQEDLQAHHTNCRCLNDETPDKKGGEDDNCGWR
ncbi:hypothetical protein V6N13_054857 [Hibiscus sabdariffa]